MKSKLAALSIALLSTTAHADDEVVATQTRLFGEWSAQYDRHIKDGAWSSVKYDLGHLEDSLAKIRKTDPKRDVKKLEQRLDDVRAQITAHFDAEKTADTRHRAIEAIEREHRDALRYAAAMAKGPLEHALKERLDAIRELEEVEKACREANVADAPDCQLAANRAAYPKQIVEKEMLRDAGEVAKKIELAIGHVAGDGTLTDDTEQLLAAGFDAKWSAPYGEAAKLAGIELPAGALAPITEARGKLVAAIDKAKKVSRLPKGYGGAPGSVVADVTAAYSGPNAAKVVSVVLKPEWSVSTNDYGAPVERWTNAAVLIQRPGETHCRLVLFNATQKYTGGGGYGAAHAGDYHPEYQVGACR